MRTQRVVTIVVLLLVVGLLTQLLIAGEHPQSTTGVYQEQQRHRLSVAVAATEAEITLRTHQKEEPPTKAPCPRRKNYAILSYFCVCDTCSAPEYVQLAVANREQYAARHGYAYVDMSRDEETLAGCRKETMFYRYTVMRRLLPKYDGILWADVDSLFINFTRTLEELMDPRFDLFITVAPESNRHYAKYSNNGHLFVRNTPWGIWLLDELIRLSKIPCQPFRNNDVELNTIGHGWIPLCKPNGNWHDADQGLIIAVTRNYSVDPNWGCKVKYMPFAAFNSDFPWYRSGDLIVHFPGKSNEERARLMKKFLAVTDLEAGVVRHELDPDIKPEVDTHLNGAKTFDEIMRVYDIWNTPCPGSSLLDC